MYMLAEYATFRTANMIAFEKFNLPEFMMIPAGAMISLMGMGIGFGVSHLASRSGKKPAQ